MNKPLRLFLQALIVSLPLYASNLVTFQPDTPIKASEVNNNFNYIKNILQGRNIQMTFKSFQQGNIILVDEFEDEFDKLRSLDIPVSPLNLLTIKSSELNQAFSQMKSGAEVVDDVPTTSNFSFSLDEDSQYLGTVTYENQTGSSNLEIVSPPSKGTIVVGASGNFSYSPFLNDNGADSFTFRINDGSNLSNVSTASITINPINDIPVANAQSVSTNEDIALNITLSGSDLDGSVLTYSIVSAPTNGVLTGTGSSRTYTPNANFNGSDSFTFKVNDGNLDSTTKTISITVNAVNDIPIANAQSLSTDEDVALNITLTGSDTEGSSLTYSIVTQPTNGVLTGTGSSRTYTPNSNFNGSDSFTFKVNDGSLDSTTKTISITVNPINDIPVANAQSISTDEDTALSITLTGSDTEGSSLTSSIVSPPTNGVLTVSGSNRIYTPNLNFNGSDSFTFRVNDGTDLSTTKTVSITVNPINDIPVANAQSLSTDEDTALNITLTGSDMEGSVLSYSIVSAPTNGALTGTGASRTYTPNTNFNGSDSFTFKVNDGSLDSITKTVSITVNAVNDIPVANAQSVTIDEDVALSITLTGSDPEGSPLTFLIVSTPTNGALTGSGTSRIYTPNSNFNGSDSFTFKVNDGSLDSITKTVSITVNAVNDIPIANAQSLSTNEDVALNITLTGSDIENSSLTYSVVASPTSGVLSGTGASRTYTPNVNFNGSDSFTFRVNDGTDFSTTKTVSITINAVNDIPVANAQSVATDEDVPLNITLTGSDTEGYSLIYSIVASPTNGALTGTGASRTYTPNSNFNGSDSFTFRVNDGTDFSVTQTVSITVNPINDSPTTNAQSLATNEDVPLNITLIGADPEVSALTYSIVSSPTNGALTGTGSSRTYTPNSNFNGSDSFTFIVSDGVNFSNTSTISITINPINDAPIASAQSLSVSEDSNLNVVFSATDVDGDLLTYEIVANPTKATLLGTGNSRNYKPNLNVSGADSFTFRAYDGQSYSLSATISITISAVWPTGTGGALNVASGNFPLTAGGVYNYSSINIAAGATVTISGGNAITVIGSSGPIVINGSILVANSSLLTTTSNITTPDGISLSYTQTRMPGGTGGKGGSYTPRANSCNDGAVGGNQNSGRGGGGGGGGGSLSCGYVSTAGSSSIADSTGTVGGNGGTGGDGGAGAGGSGGGNAGGRGGHGSGRGGGGGAGGGYLGAQGQALFIKSKTSISGSGTINLSGKPGFAGGTGGVSNGCLSCSNQGGGGGGGGSGGSAGNLWVFSPSFTVNTNLSGGAGGAGGSGGGSTPTGGNNSQNGFSGSNGVDGILSNTVYP